MDTATTMPLTREQKGLRIAQRSRIKAMPHGAFLVPSESSGNNYVVKHTDRGVACSCPDFELRREPCKHIYATEFSRMAEMMPDGSTKTVDTLKVTYRQDWPKYNLAQSHEKEDAARLLRSLCDGVKEPPATRGRPRLPLSDRLFCVVVKTFDGMSARRSSTDMREWADRGLISKAPSYNSVIDYFDDAALTPILRTLIEESAAPLRSVESQFAVDSTGFSTCTYKRWFDEKYGRERSELNWMKAHTMIGCKTNIVCSVIVTDSNGHDSPQFPGLVDGTTPRFDVKEVSADKAYSSYENLKKVDGIGATPFVAFKMNAIADGYKAPEIWTKMFHYFQFRKQEYMHHYHQRSNVECTYSAIKRKFGASLRSKTRVAQENEILAKILRHNLSVLVHASYELGIASMFWRDETPAPAGATSQSESWEMIELPDAA